MGVKERLLKTEITKDQLRELNKHRGEVETDSGKIFAGFAGAISLPSRLYVGDVLLEDVGEDVPDGKFSLLKLTKQKQKQSLKPSAKPSEENHGVKNN